MGQTIRLLRDKDHAHLANIQKIQPTMICLALDNNGHTDKDLKVILPQQVDFNLPDTSAESKLQEPEKYRS